MLKVKCFLRMRKAKKKKLQKIFWQKERKILESLVQVYINDIHVMDVFLVWSHNEILGY